MSDSTSVMDLDVAREIAASMIARWVARGWSRQTILGCPFEYGTTACRRGFYVIRSGGSAVALIAFAPFAFTCFSEANGRGGIFSIRDLPPPLSDRAHAGTEELQPFQAGDKVWSWYKDEPNANSGPPDLPCQATSWRRRPRLFTVRSASGPHTESGFCAGRPHYLVKLRYQEGPSADHYKAGNYDLGPISGRPWQMRARGEYLQLAQRAPSAGSGSGGERRAVQPQPSRTDRRQEESCWRCPWEPLKSWTCPAKTGSQSRKLPTTAASPIASLGRTPWARGSRPAASWESSCTKRRRSMPRLRAQRNGKGLTLLAGQQGLPRLAGRRRALSSVHWAT